MTRVIILLSALLFGSILHSQDLIQRTLLDIPADNTLTPGVVADQIYHKSDLTEIDLFSISDTKSELAVEGIKLSLNYKWINALHKKQDYKISIPVSTDKSIKLKLYPYDIRSSYYNLTTSDNVKSQSSKVSFYKGVVEDDPQSLVQMTITEEDVRMLIFDSNGAYNLGPVASSDDYILYNGDVLGELPFDCHTGDATIKPFESYVSERGGQVEKSGECVKVYIEVDHASYNNFGQSVTAAENFALNSFAQVAILYEHLYNGSANSVPIEISGVKVWNTQDVYGAASNVSTALNRLKAAVNPAQNNADLVHLISAKNSNSFSGIAFVSCRGFSGPCKATTIGTNSPFAVSQTSLNYQEVPNYNWTVQVLTHEMGHNMGSPHTQACVWGAGENQAIDGCSTIEGNCSNPGYPSPSGTIMSYCHFFGRPGISFTNGFGSEVGNHIFSEYQYAASNFLSACENIPSPPPEPEVFCESSTSLTQDNTLTFESSDLGIWSNNTNDDINWQRQSGQTPSSNTGPSAAYQGSYYYFIEASDPNYPGKEAILTTDCIELFQLTAPKLTFRFHMYGATMGSLQVNVLRDNGSVNVFSVSGDQGNQWYQTTIDLQAYQNETIQIEIAGLTGQQWQSDIAIDLVSIIQESNSCNDGIQNGDESGVDCGGSYCDPCLNCDANSYTVNSTMVVNNNEERIIKNNINTNASIIVQNGADIFWQAGGEIKIDGQLEVKVGSSLVLQTADCSN